jgi:hypothetical protein
MCSESDVIPYRDIKIGMDIWVTDRGNPDVRHGGLADAWIRRQRDNALLVYRCHGRVEREAIKENLPVSRPDGDPLPAVGGHGANHQSTRFSWTQSGLG